MKTDTIRIGTRGSALALAQAHETRDRLIAAHGLPQDAFEIVVMSTAGDRVQDRPLAEIGGKGLFTAEIEEALLKGGIDLAVHSSKDMPTALPDGLYLSAFLEREDPRDAFIGRDAKTLMDLPHGATVGSSSLRRQALITPECGLSAHTPAVAERVFKVTAEIGRRVRDQATATRWALGA